MAARPTPKSGSKAERDALRTEMTAAGAGPAAVMAEMRARWGMRPREAWRHAYGWSLQEAADRINAASADSSTPVSMDSSLLGKIEKWPAPGSRRPALTVLALLAEVYHCTVDDLLDLEDLRQLPDADLRVLRRTGTGLEPAAPHPALPPAAREEQDSQHQVLAAAGESASWAQWAEASNVGDIALEQLLADIRAISSEYLSAPPMSLFGRTRILRDRVFRLLEGHQTPQQTSELYVAAGYLCSLLAWMSSDLGQRSAADTQGRTAWLCAELAGHDGLRAWVCSTRSKVAFWDGRYRDAIQHARRGASYTAPGTVGLLLACQEADAWAELGVAHEAQEALNRANTAADRQTGLDEIDGLYSCNPFRHANYSSAVHLRTGRPGDALGQADAALAELARYPVHGYGTEAQMHIIRASALLAQEAPDGALEALRPVLSLRPDQRLDTLGKRLRQLAATAARSRIADTAQAQELQGVIEVYCRESAPQLALSSTSGEDGLITP